MNTSPRLLAARYEVGELIGRGGMAEVHIGHDTRLGRTVAIKILRSDLARDPSFQARFRREAQAAASLNHPAIVAVYDTGEDVTTGPDGVSHHVPFIVMEYVEGHTVRDILRDGHAVPIEEAVEITAGVLSALEYSHHAGIVHRDVKPANVMLTPTGAVKVMDFGIARALADSAATMTQTQAVIGTAQYLSPEQARGESVDARSDLYSTGCLLFELLTGRPPFVGDSPVSVVYQHVREVAPVPSSHAADVPEALDRITVKALAKDREDRYGNAAEFRADLEAAVRGEQVAAPPVPGALGAAAVGAAAAGFGASAGDEGPPTMATQVMGGAPEGGTQVLPPAAAPGSWSPLGSDTASYDAADDDEPRRRKGLMWALIAVAVAAVAGIIAIIVLSGEDEPPPVTQVVVPDVHDLPEADARALIEDADLVWAREQVADDTIAAGNAVRSDPPADAEVDPETVVTVYISTGPDSVTIPNVAGRTQAEAIRDLEDAGLNVLRTAQDHDPNMQQDRATRTDPPADSTAARGDDVVLYVSSGQVDLPNLVGLTLAEAQDVLNELRLNYTDRPVESEEPEGRVIAQDRSPGLVAQGTRIVLDVAIPIPEPDPTPTQDPTPTSTPTTTTDPDPDPDPTTPPGDGG